MEPLILLGSGAMTSGPCLTGVFSLCFLLFVTIWVTSLGSILRSCNFAELQFYPMFSGSPKWFALLPPSDQPRRRRIAQVPQNPSVRFD